jgi:hypothetical protein
MKPSPQLEVHAARLLDLLKQAGIDAMPVRDDTDQNYTQELVLFFDDGDKFVISIDPRTPIVWLKGVHV